MRQSSISWPIIGQGISAGLTFVASLLFARLAGPTEFGTYAFGLAIISTVTIAFDSCLVPVLLTAGDISTAQAHAWRVLSVCIGALGGALSLGVALVLVDADNAIGWLLLCASVPANSASFAARATAIRSGQLRSVALADAISAGVASGAVLALALEEPSFTVLCAFPFVLNVTRALLLHRHGTPWQSVSLRYLTQQVRTLAAATRGLYVLQLFSFASRNLDNVLVGAALGPVALAMYSRAYSLLVGPLTQGQIALSGPAISRMHTRTADVYTFSAQLASLLFPFVFVALLLNEEIFDVVLGPEWDQAAQLLPTCCIAVLFMTWGIPFRWLLQARRAHRRLRLDAAVQLLPLAAVGIGCMAGDVRLAVTLLAFVAAPLVTATEFALAFPYAPKATSLTLGFALLAGTLSWQFAAASVFATAGVQSDATRIVLVGAAAILCSCALFRIARFTPHLDHRR